MTSEYELPPLPDPVTYAHFTDDGMIRIWSKERTNLQAVTDAIGKQPSALISLEQAEAYAREAIEADRKRTAELLKNPVHVHSNMCRGIIAPITFDMLAHVLGEEATNEWLRKRRGEPVAWAAFADNGNIRIWTAKKGEAKRLSEQVGQTLRPLYAAPQPAVQSEAEVVETCRAMGANSFAEFFGKTAPQPTEPSRGEPVGYIMPTAIKQLKAGGNAIVGGVSQGCDVPIYTAPQPAEPVKSYLTVKYDDKGDCLYVCCDSNEPALADEDENGVLHRRAMSDGRLVGVTIPDFKSRPNEPVKVPSNTDIDELSREWGLQSAAYPSKSMVRDFARALLARYTTTKEQP